MSTRTSANRTSVSESPAIDLQAWIYLIREKLWLIALCVLLALGAGYVYLQIAPEIYTARSVVQVEQEATKVLDIKDITPEDLKTIEAVKTVEGALGSNSLMLRVVKVNKLDKESPEFAPTPGEGALTDSQLTEIMRDKTTVRLRRGTRLIEINVDDIDPARAARLAKSVVEEYIRVGFEQQAQVIALANEMLLKQAADVKVRLEKSEQALQDYKEKFGTNSLEEKQNITTDKLKELNKNLQEAKMSRIRLEADLPVLRQAQTLPVEELLAVESVSKAPDIQETLKLITKAESDFAQLQKRYLELHPRYIEAKGQVTDLRQALDRATRKAATMVTKSWESMKETETKLEEALKEQERLSLELSRIAIPYGVLLRDNHADRALYESLLARVKETKVAEGLERSNVRLIEDPIVPKWPSKPRKARTLAAAGAGGLVVAFALLFLLQAFDSTLRSVDQAEQTLGLPSLSAVPQASGKAARTPLVLIDQPGSREAEAFRCLRTSLSLQADEPPKTVIFTSAVPSEGKSYCAANYAVALAQQGHRTLLIDADLRRPGLGAIFPPAKEGRGLSELLAEGIPMWEVCHETKVGKLSVMPAGKRIATPAELLSGNKFPEALKKVFENFDRVVIDTAPINAVSDTLLIVDHADAICFVVRSRKTPARVLQRALHLLELAGTPPVGFVLNRLPAQHAHYYYYDQGNYASAGVYGT